MRRQDVAIAVAFGLLGHWVAEAAAAGVRILSAVALMAVRPSPP